MKSSCIGFLFYAIAGSVLYTLNAKAQRIRGTPGVDYPNYQAIPKISFKCSEQKYIPGFYADLDTDCQVFHFCYNHRQESFLCPTGTTFNQPILACDSWYSSNCSLAPQFYSVNAGSGIENSRRTIPMLLKLRERAKINSPVTSTEAVFDKISSLYESSTQIETKVKDANGEIQTSEVLINETSDVKGKEQDSMKLSKSFVEYANQNAENSSQVDEKLAEKPVNIQSQEEQDHRKAKSSSEINESTLEELKFLSELYQAQTEEDSYAPVTDGHYMDDYNSGFPKDIQSNEQENRQAKSSSEINESTLDELKFLSELYQGQTEEDYDAVTDGYYMDDHNLGFPEEVQREEERDRKAKSSSEINESTLDELRFLSELYQGQTEDYDAVTDGYYMDDYNSGFHQKFKRDEQNRVDKNSGEINESTLEELKFLEDLYQRQNEADLVYDPITEGYYMDNYDSSKTEWQQDSDSMSGKFQNFYDYRNSAEFDDQIQDESELLQFQENDLDEQFGKTHDSLEVQTESLPEDITFVADYERRSDSLDEVAEFSKRILQTDQNSKRYRRKPMYIVIEDEPEQNLSTEQNPNLYPVEHTKFASEDLTGYNADLPNEFGAEKNETNKNYEENVDDGNDETSRDFKNSFAEDYRPSMPLMNSNSLEISDSGEQRNYENEDSEVEQILLEDEQLSSNKDESEGEIDYSDPLVYSDMAQEGYQSDTSFEYKDSNEFEEETYPAVVYGNDKQVEYKFETYPDVVNGNDDEQFEYKTESYPYSGNIGYEILDTNKSDDPVEYGENESELDIMQSLTEDYRMVADDSYRSNFNYEENYSSEPMNEIDPDLEIETYESDDTELLPGYVREQNSPELTMEEHDESFIVIPDDTDSEDEVLNSQFSGGETRYNLGSDTLPEITMEEHDESFIVIPDDTYSEDEVLNSQSSDGETRYNLGSDTLPEITMEEHESFIVIPDDTDSDDEVLNSQSSDGETRYNLASDTLPESLDYLRSQMGESQFGISSQNEYDRVTGIEQTEDIESESYDDAYGSINGPPNNFESAYQEIESRVHPEGYNLISNIETREIPESDYQYMVQDQESPSSPYEYAENPESSRFDFQDDLSRSNYGYPHNLFSADGSYSYGYVQPENQPVDYINYPYGTQFGYYENGDNVGLLNENIENQSTISEETGVEYTDLDQTIGSDIAINPEYSIASETDSLVPMTYTRDSDGTESKNLSDAVEYLQVEEEENNSTSLFTDGIFKINADSEVDSNSSVLEDEVNLFGLKIDENAQNEETYFVFDSDEDTDGQASEVIEDFSSYKLSESNDESESAEQSYEKEQIESKESSENLDGRDVLTHGEMQSTEADAVNISFNAQDIPAEMKPSLSTIDKYSSNSTSLSEVVASLNDKGKILDAESEVNADGILSGMNSKQIIDAWSPNTRSIDQANRTPATQSTSEQLTGLKPVKAQSPRNNFKSPTETEFLNNMAFQNSMNLEPYGFGSNAAQQFSRMESSNSIPFNKLEGRFSSQAEESEKSRLSKLSLLQNKVRSLKQGKFGMFKKYMNSMKKQ